MCLLVLDRSSRLKQDQPRAYRAAKSPDSKTNRGKAPEESIAKISKRETGRDFGKQSALGK